MARNVRNPFLGEIESEIVGMQYHEARLGPGEQINLERESTNAQVRYAIRVENGQCDPVGYLPARMACWLAPLIDQGEIRLDGYVPQDLDGGEETARCPVTLMVFQGENGRRLLQETDPHSELEALHQTVLHAYENAQGYRSPELILGLAKRLRPLERQGLLPKTRLLLALLARMAEERRAS